MKSWRQAFIVLFILVLVFSSFELISPLRRIADPLLIVSRPIEGALYTASEKTRAWMFHVFGGSSADELMQLRAQVLTLGVDRTELVTLREENQTLKQLVNLRQGQEQSIIAARVIGRDPRNPSSGLTVSAGSHDGVISGAAVVNTQGELIGVVDQVSDVIASVRLLYSQNLKLPVRVVGHDTAVGLLESPEGLSLHVTQLPHDVPLAVGDVIVTSGEAQSLSPGIPIGTVLSLSLGTDQLWQDALIAPLNTKNTPDIVSVILPTYHAQIH